MVGLKWLLERWPVGILLSGVFFSGVVYQDWREHELLGGHPEMEERMADVQKRLAAVEILLRIHTMKDRPNVP